MNNWNVPSDDDTSSYTWFWFNYNTFFLFGVIFVYNIKMHIQKPNSNKQIIYHLFNNYVIKTVGKTNP